MTAPVIAYRENVAYRRRKRALDLIIGACALLVALPILAIAAIAIRLEDGGSILFRQRRVGRFGRVFTIYKLRTMSSSDCVDALSPTSGSDARVTRVGAILRKTSIDELPQFFNVLRGDMSVVGPRPHALEHDDLYQKVVSGYIHRYRIKPGITGWAQVNGFRGETDRIEKMEGRVAHDLYYLGNWSFGLDMKIIFATIFKGLRHTNAY
jgi:lipopolysaccharide/colanic/teichoic acid biosynthesis glycosyltransferase